MIWTVVIACIFLAGVASCACTGATTHPGGKRHGTGDPRIRTGLSERGHPRGHQHGERRQRLSPAARRQGRLHAGAWPAFHQPLDRTRPRARAQHRQRQGADAGVRRTPVRGRASSSARAARRPKYRCGCWEACCRNGDRRIALCDHRRQVTIRRLPRATAGNARARAPRSPASWRPPCPCRGSASRPPA